jgi:hypothetical protein
MGRIAVIVATLFAVVAIAPVAQAATSTPAQAAHVKKRCKSGYRKKTRRIHGKRHVHCVKRKAPKAPEGAPQTPPPAGATPTDPTPGTTAPPPPGTPSGPPTEQVGPPPFPPPPPTAQMARKTQTAHASQGCSYYQTTNWEQGYWQGYPYLWTYGNLYDCGLYGEVDIYYWDGAQIRFWFYYFVS